MAGSAPAARSSSSSGISNVRMCRSISAKSLRVSMAHPQCSQQSRRTAGEKPACLSTPDECSFGASIVWGSRTGEKKAKTRSDPAIITPAHSRCLPTSIPRQTRAAGSGGRVLPGWNVRRARPRTQKKPGGSLLPARLDEASTRKPCVKAPSPSAWGLIPSILSGSKYTNLSSALR